MARLRPDGFAGVGDKIAWRSGSVVHSMLAARGSICCPVRSNPTKHWCSGSTAQDERTVPVSW